MSPRGYLFTILTLIAVIFAALFTPIPTYVVPGSQCPTVSNCDWASGSLRLEPSLALRVFVALDRPFNQPEVTHNTEPLPLNHGVKVPGPVPLEGAVQTFQETEDPVTTGTPRVISPGELKGNL